MGRGPLPSASDIRVSSRTRGLPAQLDERPSFERCKTSPNRTLAMVG